MLIFFSFFSFLPPTCLFNFYSSLFSPIFKELDFVKVLSRTASAVVITKGTSAREGGKPLSAHLIIRKDSASEKSECKIRNLEILALRNTFDFVKKCAKKLLLTKKPIKTLGETSRVVLGGNWILALGIKKNITKKAGKHFQYRKVVVYLRRYVLSESFSSRQQKSKLLARKCGGITLSLNEFLALQRMIQPRPVSTASLPAKK